MKPKLESILMLAAALLPTGNLRAHPFEREYRLRLEELRVDGDLEFSVPLAKIPLDETISLDVWAEHNLEEFDYTIVRSKISICPLRSFVAPLSEDRVVWCKPNGSRQILSRVTGAGKRVPDASVGPGATTPSIEREIVYQRGNVRVVAESAPASYRVEEDGWVLFYRSTGLRRFSTPDGALFEVESAGSSIRTIRRDGKPIFEIKSVGASEFAITAASRTYHLHYGQRGELRRIDRDGLGAVVLYDYDAAGRLAAISLPPEKHQIAWEAVEHRQKHGISWIKNFHLQSFDGRTFEYRIGDGGTLALERRELPGPVKSLHVRVKYGSVVSVDEK